MSAWPHQLHPETEAYVKLLAASEATPLHKGGSLEGLRGPRTEADIHVRGDYKDYKGTRREMFIPSPDVQGGIPVWVYVPENVCENPAILIYLHGGGYVIGSRDNVDPACKAIVSESGCICVNVGYRLSPEHKYPAFIEDAEVVAKWVMQNKLKLGGSESSKVGIGGDSAGGTISAAVCHDVPGLDFQILIYPRTQDRTDYSLPSHTEYESSPMLSRDMLEWYGRQAIRSEADLKDPRWCTSLRDKFDHLPPALLIVAQCDPLRDESFEYQEKLRSAGVQCELELYEGAMHGFYASCGAFPTLSAAAHKRTADFIKQF